MTTCTETIPVLDQKYFTANWAPTIPPLVVQFDSEISEFSLESDEQGARESGWINPYEVAPNWMLTGNPSGAVWGALLSAQKLVPNRPEVRDVYLSLLGLHRENRRDTSGLPPTLWLELARMRSNTDDATPLLSFLRQLWINRIVSYDVIETAKRLWCEIRARTPAQLPEPDAAPGDDGRLMLAFDDRMRHLEFEILAGDRIEVFSLRRDNGETWETELDGRLLLEHKLLAAIKEFAR